MKVAEFVFTSFIMAAAIAVGFGCALGIATLWLRSIVGAVTRNSYNVSSVSDPSAARPSS